MIATRPLRAYVEVDLGRQRSPVHAEGPHMVSYLRAANVLDGRLDLSDVKTMNFTPAEQRRYRLEPGDVLVTEGSGSLSTVGASAVWREELPGVVCFQNTLLRLRPRSTATDARFLAWWSRFAFHDKLFASLATGANIWHLSAEKVRSLPVQFPTISAQRAIADFLDAETARIDALIAKKRQQSTLVDLRWIALVTDLVRGRHTTATHRRASGVGWIGELPEEWGTPSVVMKFDVELGKMLNQRAAEGENQRPYLRNQNVQWDGFNLNDVATMHFDQDESGRFTVRKGDLLVCEGGDVGRAALWSSDEEIHYQKALHRVRPRTNAPPRFLMYVLWAASLLGVFAIEGNQSTIVHLTREQLRAHRIPWPSKEQQRRIVAELDESRAKMRNLQERWAKQIQLLTEHRQALITAAVTGQMEVPLL